MEPFEKHSDYNYPYNNMQRRVDARQQQREQVYTTEMHSGHLIDKYYSEENIENRISLTFRIRYRKKESTLTENEINPYHDKIVSTLVKNHDAKIRS